MVGGRWRGYDYALAFAAAVWNRRETGIAAFSAGAIALHLVLRFSVDSTAAAAEIPLQAVLVVGGVPLVLELLVKLLRREFGSDLVAGVSIVTSAILGQYLAGAIVVLMLAGGGALESYALRSASSVLAALAARMPSVAHRKRNEHTQDVALEDVVAGDILVVYPHETCPADGIVVEGHGVMDESYLTGEPFEMTKTAGSAVISGAINGHTALTIEARRRPADSRYAKIMEVMRESEETRPRLRRLGDQLGALYTPASITLALVAWAASHDATRFLAVLVVATPCPLLIAIPVAIIGSISLCARRAIIVRNPVVLEQITACRTAIFDKTGTLTYGTPTLTDQIVAPGFTGPEVLGLAAALERYSKHPLAQAVTAAAAREGIGLTEAADATEPPGTGLIGHVAGHRVEISSRSRLMSDRVSGAERIPPAGGGLECVVAIDGRYAATYRFRDAPRSDSRSFVSHLSPKHHFTRLMIVSGDREAEVRYLADQVGITEIHAPRQPEEKLAIVRRETAAAKTLYVGDGINDAPAMMAATVGIAIGQNSDVTSEAAGVVIMDNVLSKVDEFFHISRRMRTIALQSAVGGMLLSLMGMVAAAFGLLDPVQGAVIQEVIDVVAVLNAVRAAFPPQQMHDL